MASSCVAPGPKNDESEMELDGISQNIDKDIAIVIKKSKTIVKKICFVARFLQGTEHIPDSSQSIPFSLMIIRSSFLYISIEPSNQKRILHYIIIITIL